ncbi:uncharacterized protein CMU_025230 [Cryptosporidium muris RN66]|uniref:Structural maintenance of chromosomes protein 5 n=1 Tax=Cryptosporidium muris (strain RN66) TaxID=441375 RepID=B6AAW5_CRYMR|nr:uncharacterized protein CMU_025230 [Cryptosporidium muris RN66]EEA05517.1 hypothetical protein, conserved [Cryptosporidium muris RN66]|eukprot:XP_002139866.1 hypothetical protein [Cryptosporidium muris RN66]
MRLKKKKATINFEDTSIEDNLVNFDDNLDIRRNKLNILRENVEIGDIEPSNITNKSNIDIYNNKGTLYSISLENWMNIEGPLVYVFEDNVNIIAGLNGSGKSSVVCGIAIGLGYDTNILARGHLLASYIRNGCKYSKLKLILNKDKGQRVTIDRTLTLSNNNEVRTLWKLDGLKCNEKDITTLRKEMNIQLDNMISFLAQQRVSQFATQSSQYIFKETIRALSKESNNNNNIDDINIDNLTFFYNKFLDITKSSQSLRSNLYGKETKLVQIKNEILKAEQNEINYIRYIYCKMAMELIKIFEILIEGTKEKECLKNNFSIIEGKKKDREVLEKNINSEINKIDELLSEQKKYEEKYDDIIKDIENNKLNGIIKHSHYRIKDIIKETREKIEDPELSLEAYYRKIKDIECLIKEIDEEVDKYEESLNNNWILKWKNIGLSLLRDKQDGFLLDEGEELKIKIGKEISQISSEISLYERNIRENDHLKNKLIQRKSYLEEERIRNINDNRENKDLDNQLRIYLNNVKQSALSNLIRQNIMRYFSVNKNISDELYAINSSNISPKGPVYGPIDESIKNILFQIAPQLFLCAIIDLSNNNNYNETEPGKEFNNRNKVINLNEDKILYELSEWLKNKYGNINPRIYQSVQLLVLNNIVKKELNDNNIINRDNYTNSNIGKFGTLYKLISSLYNTESKTISSNNLDEPMNTVLLLEEYEKYNSNKSQNKDKYIDMEEVVEINNRISKITEDTEQKQKKCDNLRMEYNKKREILNILIECLVNIPSIYKNILKIKNLKIKYQSDLKKLNNSIKPDKSKILNKNKESICYSIFGNKNMEFSEDIHYNKINNERPIYKELLNISEILEDIANIQFRELINIKKKISEISNSITSLNSSNKLKSDELQKLNRIIELNEIEYNKIKDLLSKMKLDLRSYYAQFYSLFYQYYTRIHRKSKDLNLEQLPPYYYLPIENENSNNENFEALYKIPGMENILRLIDEETNNEIFYSNIATDFTPNQNIIPQCYIEIIKQVCTEFQLLSNLSDNIEYIFDIKYCNKDIYKYGICQKQARRISNRLKTTNYMYNNVSNNRNPNTNNEPNSNNKRDYNYSILDILLPKSKYQDKYNDILNTILKLEYNTHDTNLERLNNLQNEYEILNLEKDTLQKKINEFENYIFKYSKKWLLNLNIIQSVLNDRFFIFMNFINEGHSGKVIIPFYERFKYKNLDFLDEISTSCAYSEKDTTNCMESDNSKYNLEKKKEFYDIFINNFEKDHCINILVKFGIDEEFRLFSSSSISGGEQSLCTILYILALQGLCRSNSFTLYDEINQGLDNSRELKLMELLNILSCEKKVKELFQNKKEKLGSFDKYNQMIIGTKMNQIIIITPHLLPGIMFKDFSIHFVLNGPGFYIKG